MTKHIDEPWQGGDGAQTTRVWAHLMGGAVIIADFSVSTSLRQETKVANARRARAAVNLCHGMSIEQIEEMLKDRRTVAKLLAEIKGLRAFKASVDEALNTGDGSYRP